MVHRLLFVDDEPMILRALRRALIGQVCHWDMSFETSSEIAWERLRSGTFDLVVSDIAMPDLTGLELLERLKGNESTRNIAVVLMTGRDDVEFRFRAFELGASDFVRKPLDSVELLARIQGALRLKSAQDQLRRRNASLEALVEQRGTLLHQSRLDLIWRLAKAAEYRDEETGNHVVRVGCYAREIGRSLGLSEADVKALYITAPLHDIGKIGVPDRILLKPGKLDADEWAVMKSHCEIGAQILNEESKAMAWYQDWYGEQADAASEFVDPIIDTATEIALTHHEKWNGSGYPAGLAGEAIPLSGRIVAICDVFDALRSARPYKPAFPEEKALKIISEESGRHFDPRVYEAFVASLDFIREVHAELSDSRVSANHAIVT